MPPKSHGSNQNYVVELIFNTAYVDSSSIKITKPPGESLEAFCLQLFHIAFPKKCIFVVL